MSLEDMAHVMRHLPVFTHPDLIVGPKTLDDAGVYRLRDDLAVVQTVDVFPPIVDDPYVYGQIVAANSLSDVYAMGADPLTVLNIVGFPVGKLDKAILTDILRGGADKVTESGALIVGGHTLRDEEIKYGMAVTGVVHPDRIVTNAGARPGDAVILTKKIGTGVISTAMTEDRVPEELIEAVCRSMAALNKTAAEVMREVGASAGTDVTGFGLVGHAKELADASEVTVVINADSVPRFAEAEQYAAEGMLPGGSAQNRAFLEPFTDVGASVSPELADVLFDAQTSGGLLITVPGPEADGVLRTLRERDVPDAAAIGEIVERGEASVVLR
jgi:selenide,water dikinase